MKRNVRILLLLLLLHCFQEMSFAQENGAKGTQGLELDVDKGPGTTVAIVVGISAYDAPSLKLNAADKDAALFAGFLTETKRVDSANLKLLLNKNANSNAVNYAIQQLRNRDLKSGDEVIIYFSGHGDIQLSKDTSTKGYVGYLLCSDVNIDRAYTGAQGTLSFKDLNEAVEELTQNGVLVSIILDACHSGQTVNEQGADMLSEGALSSFRNTIRYLSCGANQRSYEDTTVGHGYFTFYLVKGLMGEADNSPVDNKVRVNELNLYVYNNVYDESRERQEPNIGAPSGGKVVMLISAAMKKLAFDKMQQIAFHKIKASTSKGKSIQIEIEKGFTVLNADQELWLQALNDHLAKKEIASALALYKKWKKECLLPKDWLSLIKFRLVQLLSIDPQEAVNTVLLGKNNLPPASYFKAAADKSYELVAILDSTDYGYTIYSIYGRYLEAYSYLQAKNFKEYIRAQQLLNEALHLEPEAAFVLHALGLVAEYQNDYPLAEKYYRKAIELIPTWTYPRSSLGNALRDQDRYMEAIAVFKEVIAMAPQFSWPYNNIGNVYLDLKRYKLAESNYLHSIKIDSIGAVTEYNNLGVVAENRGNIQKADLFYSKAMLLDSNYVQSYYNKAKIYKEINASVTEDLLKEAVQREPFYAKGLGKLADHYSNGSLSWQRETADSLYSLAIQNNPYYPWGYAGKAWNKLKQKDTAAAMHWFNESIRINPSKPDAWAYFGRYFQNTKQYSKALPYFRKALELSKWHWWSYECLHDIYLKTNNSDSALWILEKATLYFEENPELYNLLGNYYYAKGAYKIAALAYGKALIADSNFANAYLNLAYTSLETGDYNEAVTYFRKSYENNPLLLSIKDIVSIIIDKTDNLQLEQKNNEALQLMETAAAWISMEQTAFYLKLSTLYYFENRPEKAIAILNAVLKEQQLSESFKDRFLQLLGWCYLDKGDFTKAEEQFMASIKFSKNPSYLGLATASMALQKKEEQQQWLRKQEQTNNNWKDQKRWSKLYSSKSIKLLNRLSQ